MGIKGKRKKLRMRRLMILRRRKLLEELLADEDHDYDDDDDDDDCPFDAAAFRSFITSLPQLVERSCGGKRGDLYRRTIKGVVRILVKKKLDDGKFHSCQYGCGVVIAIAETFALIVSCKHVLLQDDGEDNMIMVYNYKLKPLEVTRTYIAQDMDCSVLRVEGDIDDLERVEVYMGPLSFGQKVFVISCPNSKMCVTDNVKEENPDLEDYLDVLLFPMACGSINHPFLVGTNREHLSGEYINYFAGGITSGSSGAPVFDDKGRVVGIHLNALKLNTISEEERAVISQSALSMNSVMNWIQVHQNLKILAPLILCNKKEAKDTECGKRSSKSDACDVEIRESKKLKKAYRKNRDKGGHTTS